MRRSIPLIVGGVFLLAAVANTVAGPAPGASAIRSGDADRPGRSIGWLPPASTDADFRSASAEQVELGKALFFDKILGGNRNISCATCHHALTDTGDGLSLPLGEGAQGLGVARQPGDTVTGVHERVPRNAPHVFNLGAYEFTTMFHDGRVTEDPNHPSGFQSPAGLDLPAGLDSALAVQAMFPVTSGTEMAGQPGENSVADAAGMGNLAGAGGVWEQLAERLQGNATYVAMFQAAYADVLVAGDITFVHVANAIAAFEGTAWRADNSPFDRYLRGDSRALSSSAKRGMTLFYGKAGCSSCHVGTFQTDHQFHAVAMPQIGAGTGDGVDGHDDFGRERVTADADDRYKFRTPTLRNIALTAPYGHAGAYDSLEAAVLHQLDPVYELDDYDTSQAALPPRADLDALDFIAHNDPARRGSIADACELQPVDLSDKDVQHLIDFMHALTDPGSIDLRNDVPMTVPSGDPLAD